jgi:hypothetical protein
MRALRPNATIDMAEALRETAAALNSASLGRSSIAF